MAKTSDDYPRLEGPTVANFVSSYSRHRAIGTRWRRVATIAIGVLAVSVLAVAPVAAVSMPPINCAVGDATFRSVDNSGFDRSFSMNHSIWKQCGASAKTQYKMNFGSLIRTDWKTGLTKYTNGVERGVVRDNFYYSNSARGAWVRLCNSFSCGSAAYVDNPYN